MSAAKDTAKTPTTGDDTCPQCGMARSELYSNGQMGCEKCYATFGAEVQQALKEIHGETRHLGKHAA